MKKIYTILMIVGFLILYFLAFTYFIDFKKLTMASRFSFEFSSFLIGLNFFIFSISGLLFILKLLFPKIYYRYVTDSINNPIYILVACIALTLAIPLIIFGHLFSWKYLVIIFIYLFGIVTICLRIFFNK